MIARWAYRLWSFFVNSARLWGLLDQAGIVVFVGPNGSGKSLVMVEGELGTLGGVEWTCFDVEHGHHSAFLRHCEACPTCSLSTFAPYAVGDADGLDALRSESVICSLGHTAVREGSTGVRRVYSTVPLTVSKGVAHPLYVPLTDYRQLLHIEHADLLFDEVAGIADASGSASMPVQVINWLHKLRKADVRLRVTTPAYGRCALPIRQVAQVVVEMRSFFPARAEGKLWRPRRLILATAYDAFEFDDFVASEGQRARLRPRARALVWVPSSGALSAYNSFGQVLQLGHVNEAGMCVACGGTRSRPRCGCEGDLPADADVQVVTVVSNSGARTRKAVPQ